VSKGNLNLALLRKAGCLGMRLAGRCANISTALPLTRRGFLKTSALAAAGSASASWADIYGLSTQVTVRNDRNQASVYLDGKEYFVVDAKRFSGQARVEVQRRSDGCVISLRGARFPGLLLPADLTLDVWAGPLGWRYALLLLGMDARATGALVPWLLGESPAQASMMAVNKVATSQGLELFLTGTIDFAADWTFQFRGGPAGQVHFDGYDFSSNQVTLSLPQPGNLSLLPNAPRRRTAIDLNRGGREWSYLPAIVMGEGVSLEHTGPAFDRLHIEAVESSKGNRRFAILLEGDQNALRVRSVPDFITDTGTPFMLSLGGVRYASAPETGEGYLSARLLEDSNAKLGGMIFRLQNPGDKAVLEAKRAAQDDKCIACLNVGTGVHALLPGAVVKTSAVPHSAGLRLTFGEILCRIGDFLHLNPHHRTAYSSADKIRVSMLRPQDLLSIDLQFKGMHFHHAWGNTYLIPDGDRQDAKLIVEFAPQALAEKCLEGKPSGVDPKKNPPPIPVRLAEPSRLVFRPFAQNSVEKLRFELEDLLQWSTWEVAVNKFAVEPTLRDGSFSMDGRLPEDFSYKGDVHGPSDDDLRSRGLLDPYQPPACDETALELPYGVILSPNSQARFNVVDRHVSPITGRTALWHTLIHTADTKKTPSTPTDPNQGKKPRLLPTVRVIGYRSTPDPPIDPVSIEDQHRQQLFAAFTTYKGNTFAEREFIPPAMPVDLLALSAAGGWLRGAITWEPLKPNVTAGPGPLPATPTTKIPPVPLACNLPARLQCANAIKVCPGGNQVSGWTEDIAQGRENHAVLTFDGYLLPCGHPATFVKDTKRLWVQIEGTLYSYEITFLYISIPERKKVFPALEQGDDIRHLPFRSVEILVDRTPNLDEGDENSIFWPVVNCIPFRFPLHIIDQDNNELNCDLPLQFLPKCTTFADDPADVLAAIECYAKVADAEWADAAKSAAPPKGDWLTISQFAGQKVAYARSKKPADTHLPTRQIFWYALKHGNGPNKALRRAQQPPWYPAVRRAEVEIEALRGISTAGVQTFVEFAAPFLANGFPDEHAESDIQARSTAQSSNRGEIFLQLAKDPTDPTKAAQQVAQEFDAKLTGCVALPSTNVVALSRHLGPVGGDIQQSLDSLAQGDFDPIKFFAKSAPKLLGAIELAEIIATVTGFRDQINKVPTLVRSVVSDISKAVAQAQTAIAEIKTNIQTVAAPLKAYHDAAVSRLKALQNQALEAGIEAASSLLAYADVPPDLQKDAATVSQTIDSVRADFITQVKNASDLSLLREYFIFRATKEVEVDQQQLDDFRAKFHFEAEKKVAFVRGALLHAVDHVTNQLLGTAIVEFASVLDSAITQASPAAIASALAQLSPAVDDVLQAADLFTRGVEELKHQRDQIVDAIGAVQAEVKNDLTAIQKTVNDTKWKLLDDERKEFNKHVADVLATIDQQLQPIQAAADQVLWNAASNALILLDLIQNIQAQVQKYTQILRQLRDDALPALLRQLQLPQQIHLEYQFEPHLQDAGVFIASRKGAAAKLVLNAAVTQHLTPAPVPTEWSTSARLTDFGVRLLPGFEFVQIDFSELHFSSDQSGNTDITVNVDNADFLGPFDFVKQLQAFLSKLASNNGPFLEIALSAVTAGLHFQLPPLQAGLFSLSNVRLETAIRLPLLSKDSVTARFAFSQRTRPFLLSFGVFGGGGFFALELTASKIVQVEAALEFGAVAALDLVVAHGAVQIVGGFYYRQNGDGVLLTGYFRAYGELEVLGIATMTMQFWLSLSYEQRLENSAGKKESIAHLVGECTVSVEIQIGFFSVGASVTLRREFSRSGGGGQAFFLTPDNANPSTFSANNSVSIRHPSDADSWAAKYLAESENWAC
jgi:hypothetical protein